MRLLIAGGGTGGHLFPGLAVAEAVKKMDSDNKVLFVGTRNGIEARVIPETEFPIRFVTARGMKRTGAMNFVKGLVEIPLGVIQSMAIIRDFRPDTVLGVGGYASGPTLFAAWLLRIPTAVQEQNSVMGTTNRLLAKLVRRIFISWEGTEPRTPDHKTILTGNPVRADLLKEAGTNLSKDDRFHLLIFGGSRGARSINLSIIQNLDALSELGDSIRIVHQTGLGADIEVRDAYQKAGLDADVLEFIDDMASAYRWADLVVCRSGASSLAELTAVGKPAVVIPYPYAIGDHQARNAAVLENEGAVHVVPDGSLKNGVLAAEICDLVGDSKSLKLMAGNSKRLGRPGAAEKIAAELPQAHRSRA